MFLQNVLDLLKEKGISKNKMLMDLGLGKNAFNNWEVRGTVPSGVTLSKIANYFNVTTDYLLGLNDDPNPPELVIPDVLKDVRVAFHRGAFEDLTQDEVDRLAEFATFIKSQRK